MAAPSDATALPVALAAVHHRVDQVRHGSHRPNDHPVLRSRVVAMDVCNERRSRTDDPDALLPHHNCMTIEFVHPRLRAIPLILVMIFPT